MSILLLPRTRRWMRTTCLVTCSIIVSASTAYATDVLPGETIQVIGSEYWTMDSNPLRLVRGAQSLSGSYSVAEAILGDKTPTSQLSLDSVIDEGLYDRSEFDSTDFHETADLSRTVERWSAGLEAKADYDTTRTSEITTFGITAPDVRHTGLSVAPNISFSPSDVDKLSLNGYVLKSSYDNIAFIDYDFYSLSPTYAHNFDPMNAALLTLNTQRYQTAQGPNVSVDTIGPSLGWTSILSETLNVKVTGGAEESTQNGPPGTKTTSQLNYVFSGAVTYKGQQDIADLTASRNEQPFGNGTSSLLTTFQVDEAHDLNAKITLNASASYRIASYPDTSYITLHNETIGSAGLAYHILDHLDASGNYQYLQQNLSGITGSVREQVFMIGLSYRPAMGVLQ